MKKQIMITMVLIFVGGCFPEAADIQTFTEKVTLLSSKVDAYQLETEGTIDLLVADGLISKELAAKIDKANEEIDRVQLQTTDIAEAIKDADYVSGDDIGNVIRAAKAGTAASAPWNPYATIIILGLTVLEGITALFLAKKSKDATTSKAKQQADKAGREKTLREIAALPEEKVTAPVVKSLMYNNIGEARRAIT